jgi:hypothetical protein
MNYSTVYAKLEVFALTKRVFSTLNQLGLVVLNSYFRTSNHVLEPPFLLYSYENGVKQLSGSTGDWTKFQDLRITTIFPIDYSRERVFTLNNDNNNYTFFDFGNIYKPSTLEEGHRLSDLVFKRKRCTKTTKFKSRRDTHLLKI